MNNISVILSVLITLALVVVIAPNIIAMNRGKALRNIALWLAAFLLLGLIYQNFGPESNTPLFRVNGFSQPIPHNDLSSRPEEEDKNEDPSAKGDQGFSPPRE